MRYKPSLKLKGMLCQKIKMAQTRILGYLCDSQYSARWKEIEQVGSVGPPIKALIADQKLQDITNITPG